MYSITTDPNRPDLWGRKARTVLAHMEAEDPPFLPLRVAALDPTRPLLVVIHPGDMVETAQGWGSDDQARAAVAFWQHNAQGLDGELRAARKAGHDIVVLHRTSSAEFCDTSRRHSTARTLWQRHLCPIFSTATALWGDNLSAAADWLLSQGAAGRPAVHMAGAYACPDYGCITIVAKALLAGGLPPDRLTVSPFSPPGNSPGPVWRPEGPIPMDVPAHIHALFAEA